MIPLYSGQAEAEFALPAPHPELIMVLNLRKGAPFLAHDYPRLYNSSAMHLLTCVVALLAAPLSAVALPTSSVAVTSRQRQAPPPCVRMDPAPSQNETEARFNAFVEAFVGQSKNLYEAFTYIAEDYIVGRLPLAVSAQL